MLLRSRLRDDAPRRGRGVLTWSAGEGIRAFCGMGVDHRQKEDAVSSSAMMPAPSPLAMTRPS